MSVKVNMDLLRASQDSARGYKWDVYFTGAGPENSNILSLRCTTATMPQITNTPIEVLIRGFQINEEGAPDYNELTFQVIENVSFDVLQGLWNWQLKAWNPRTGTQLAKTAHEATIDLQLLDLGDKPVKTWRLYGSKLFGLTPPDLVSDKGALIDVGFSVRYDYPELL